MWVYSLYRFPISADAELVCKLSNTRTILIIFALLNSSASAFAISSAQHTKECPLPFRALFRAAGMIPKEEGNHNLLALLKNNAKSSKGLISSQNIEALLIDLEKKVVVGNTNIRHVLVEMHALKSNQLEFLSHNSSALEGFLNMQASKCGLNVARPLSTSEVAGEREMSVSLFLIDPGPVATSASMRIVQQRILRNNYNLILEETAHGLQTGKNALKGRLYTSYLEETQDWPDMEAEVAAFIYENLGTNETKDLWNRYPSRIPFRDWVRKNFDKLKQENLLPDSLLP